DRFGTIETGAAPATWPAPPLFSVGESRLAPLPAPPRLRRRPGGPRHTGFSPGPHGVSRPARRRTELRPGAHPATMWTPPALGTEPAPAPHSFAMGSSKWPPLLPIPRRLQREELRVLPAAGDQLRVAAL